MFFSVQLLSLEFQSVQLARNGSSMWVWCLVQVLVSSWNIEHWSISIKSAYSFSNSSWFHKMSKNHLYLAIGITSVGVSFPLGPSGPCLVFLITSENSSTFMGGIRFYRAPRWAPNVLVGWLVPLLPLVTSFSPVCLFKNLFYLLLLWNVAPLK